MTEQQPPIPPQEIPLQPYAQPYQAPPHPRQQPYPQQQRLYRRPYQPQVKKKAFYSDTSFTALWASLAGLFPLIPLLLPVIALVLAYKSQREEKRGDPVTEGASTFRTAAYIIGGIGLAFHIILILIWTVF